MSRRSPFGDALVAIGLGIAALSLRVGGATERACPGIDSAIYERFGIYPNEARLASVDVLAASLEWYDGCNWHTQSLLPLSVGLFVVFGGFAVLSRASVADAHG
jgi:hypothetical protein